MGNPWADEARVTRLKELFHAGAPFSKIGAELGVSRNSAIGKCNRLGLYRLEPKPRPPKSRRSPGIRRNAPVNLNKLFAKPEPAPEPVVDLIHEEIPIKGKSLFDLQDNECRWPVGDPGTKSFCFCAREIGQGYDFTAMPYCAGHARMAFNGIPRKKDSGHFVIREKVARVA